LVAPNEFLLGIQAEQTDKKNAPAGAKHTLKAVSALRVEFLSAMRCMWIEEEKKKEG